MIYHLTYEVGASLETDFMVLRGQMDVHSDQLCVMVCNSVLRDKQKTAIYKQMLELEGTYRTLHNEWTSPRANLKILTQWC